MKFYEILGIGGNALGFGGGGSSSFQTVYPAGTGDGVTDSTVAIQTAINTANTAGGGIVQLPIGTIISTQLLLKDNVWLRGSGMNSTILKLKNATDTHLLVLATTDTQNTILSDLQLEGNSSNQTIAVNNLNYDTTATASDRHNQIFNVWSQHAKGSGIVFVAGRGEARITNVFSYFNNVYGFSISTPDLHLTGCDAGQNGKQGFNITVGNIHLVNCKSWFSGRLDTANGDGYLFSTSSRSTLAGCEAQDNATNGFYFLNSQNISATGINADSNGTGATAAGVKLDGINYTYISGTTADRNGSPLQAYGVQFANTNTNNDVCLTSRNNLTSDTNGTIAATNRVAINGTSLAPDGVVATPGYGFANEVNTGWFRRGAGLLDAAIAGVDSLSVTSSLLLLPSGTKFTWTSGSISGGTQDLFLRRRGAANLTLGTSDINGTPVDQTISSQNAITGSNLPGGHFTLDAPLGTGTGAASKISVNRALMGASGATAQTSSNAFAIGQSKTLSNTSATAQTIATITLGSNAGGGCSGTFTIVASDGTNFDAETQSFNVSFVNKATVVTVGSVVITATTAANNSGSATLGITAVASGNDVVIKVTPVFTTIVPTTVTLYPIITHSTNTVTFV